MKISGHKKGFRKPEHTRDIKKDSNRYFAEKV